MPYLLVKDFRLGMDRRRERVAGTPGTLWLGENVHLTRGGDIERRKKFVSTYSVADTFGVFAFKSQLYVFGSADLASSMPVGVLYQRLQAPSSPAMTAILDVKTFAGAMYVIAEYDDGHVYHFYDGSRVTDWDVVAADGGSNDGVAELLADKISANDAVSVSVFGATVTLTAAVPGTAFTIAEATVDGGGTNDQDITLTAVQANVAAVAEVRASADVEITGGTSSPGSNRITSITIDGVELLSAALDWSGSHATTAIRLATDISNGFSTHGYTAEASSATVTITAAPGTGATPNGDIVLTAVEGDVTLAADATVTGGVTEVEAVAQVHTAKVIGTFEEDDTFTLTVDGTDYTVTGLASGTGRVLQVEQQRVWSPVGSLRRYCMLNNAEVWDPLNATADNDAGFINIAAETEGNERIVGMARYEGLSASFTASSVTLYQLDVDPLNFLFSNYLENTGTLAAKSIVRYGNNDVFYLDSTGIRSLRARDSTDAPFISDVGNAVDTFILDYIDTLTSEQVRNAIATIEPRDGRYWLVLGDRIFVLSYFPGSKVSAWSYYDLEELDGEPVTALTRSSGRIFLRAGDDIYTYGGPAGTTYPDEDEVIATVQTPFLSAETPATIKKLTGFDLAATNTWEVEVAFNPNRPDDTMNVGNISWITFADLNRLTLPDNTSLMATNMVCRKAGAATVSMLAIHYEGEKNPG